jgi:hypothetical protein
LLPPLYPRASPPDYGLPFDFFHFLIETSFQGSTFRQQNGDRVPGLSFEEAVELEQQAHAADLERKQRLLERRQKQGLVAAKGRMPTREEQEARIWAFMCGDGANLSPKNPF